MSQSEESGSAPVASFVAGSRVSSLAKTQTQTVVHLLEAAHKTIKVETVYFSTRGDVDIASPLSAIGGKGLFTEQLEQALRDGRIDFAVHSLKDLPVDIAPDLTIGAILGRTDPLDTLVTAERGRLDELPPGSVVGTSSPRRQAQILSHRPDLVVRSIRGNVDTRITKVSSGEYDAVILAAAGINRLGLADVHREVLPAEIMLPAPGQGALAVQCRAGDRRVLNLLAPLDDAALRNAVEAERAFLQGLGGGCAVPVAAYAVPMEESGGTSRLHLRGRVVSLDGRRVIEVEGDGSDGRELGGRLARDAIERGASSLLSPLNGIRVVVTRSAEQAQPLEQELRSHGASVILAPTIRIVKDDTSDLDRARSAIHQYDWVVFTSENGVEIGAENLDDRLAHVKVAAVGPTTAQALERHGLHVSFVPTSFTGASLGRELPDVDGKRILFIAAKDARSEMQRELEQRGATVDRVNAYHVEQVSFSQSTKEALGRGMDVVLFTSGSTAEGFAKALAAAPEVDKAYSRNHPVIACIGPTTASTARSLGFNVRIVSNLHTMHGLVEALVDSYGGIFRGT